MTYRYTIDRIPPSNNKYIGRNARWEYGKVKSEWAQLIKCCCRPVPKAPLKKAVVELTYYFPDRKRRDPDNYSGKMILDGLVRAGILVDDSFDCIILSIRAGYDKKNPRTEITITEVDDIV
ncbi:MAG: RusA family crossover junction endodeoxyribonuclease [Eubacterium sp.]|nr:RusA family crossover junction endodeoxyribonuclease [Eubacterium sp.]